MNAPNRKTSSSPTTRATTPLQVKYLNNIVDQDHCFIKKITRPMKDIEVAHMIRKR